VLFSSRPLELGLGLELGFDLMSGWSMASIGERGLGGLPTPKESEKGLLSQW